MVKAIFTILFIGIVIGLMLIVLILLYKTLRECVKNKEWLLISIVASILIAYSVFIIIVIMHIFYCAFIN